MARPERQPVRADAEESAYYAAIVASSDDAILSKDANGLLRSWNPAAERMYGYTAEEAIGQPISILIPPSRAGEELDILKRVFAGERVDHYETERLTKFGRVINVSLSISPIRDRDGEVVRASVIARDITARHRALDLASRLQRVTAAFASELDPTRVMDLMLEQAVGALGAVAGAIGEVERESDEVVLRRTLGYSDEALARFDRFPLAADVPMSRAIRDDQPMWTSGAKELADRFTDLRRAELRFGALAVVPLTVGPKPFGALALSFEKERIFDEEERAFVMAATQQGAYALDRARVYEAQRGEEESQRFLADAGELLAGSLNPDETLAELATLAVKSIADWCGIELVDEDRTLRNVAVAHIEPERVAIAEEFRQRYPVDPNSETGVPNVVRTGKTELYPEVTDEMLRAGAVDDEHLAMMRELGLSSVMVVPLRAHGRVLGAITFVASDPERHYGSRDVALAEDLARRAALAIENAMLYQREHDSALTLQRALLPQTLPNLDGVRIAARYEPAAPGLEVGGDWYEVAAAGDGTVGVTIGDVAGRGVLAAAAMGRVRPALRAFVLDGYRPPQALEALDRLVKESERPEMITVFHLQFDPASGLAEYVRAGHPPALVRLPDGGVEALDGEGTPPLGILREMEFRRHEVRLPPGSLLLLYTDGLIERRGTDIKESLERLMAAFADAPAEPDRCADWLLQRFSDDDAVDDVALLVVAVDA
jgi:PAS domain S-box-containing protein